MRASIMRYHRVSYNQISRHQIITYLSYVKTRIHCHKEMPVKQQIQAPVRDF